MGKRKLRFLLAILSLAGCADEEFPVGAESESLTSLSLQITHVDNGHRVMAVDGAGTIYALRTSAGSGRLYASRDKGATWTQRTRLPDSRIFKVMTALPSGTLLADTADSAGSHDVLRSTDGGVTWSNVLGLGAYRWLEPHTVAVLDGKVYMGLYQVFAKIARVPLYVSADDGATWSVRYTFQGYRHCHSLLADPVGHVLYAFLGDPTGAVLRSSDGGATFTVVFGPNGRSVAVDAVLTPRGLVYGTDIVYQTVSNAIMLLSPTGTAAALHALPGPAYSIHHLPGGGYLLGETREPTDDNPSVYADGDNYARIYASPTGTSSWTFKLRFTRIDTNDYGRADVYWHLPSGEAVIELRNVSGHGVNGTGFLLARAVLQ